MEWAKETSDAFDTALLDAGLSGPQPDETVPAHLKQLGEIGFLPFEPALGDVALLAVPRPIALDNAGRPTSAFATFGARYFWQLPGQDCILVCPSLSRNRLGLCLRHQKYCEGQAYDKWTPAVKKLQKLEPPVPYTDTAVAVEEQLRLEEAKASVLRVQLAVKEREIKAQRDNAELQRLTDEKKQLEEEKTLLEDTIARLEGEVKQKTAQLEDVRQTLLNTANSLP